MIRVLVVAVALVVSSAIVQTQNSKPAADPIDGTWKLNVGKSSFNPGPSPPATFVQLRHYATLPDGWNQFVQTSVNQNGEPTVSIGVYKFDGRQHPVHNAATISELMISGKASNLTRSYRRIGVDTVEVINYTNGVAAASLVRVVAKDGKSFTETNEGKNAQGQAFKNVVIYDRVR